MIIQSIAEGLSGSIQLNWRNVLPLKGPSTYDVMKIRLKRKEMITYQNRLYSSMARLLEYLERN
jgi:hypothetical protein